MEGSRKQRLIRANLLATAVIVSATFLFCFDNINEHLIFGPSDDFVVLHAAIDTWFKYIAMCVIIIWLEISILLVKLNGKSVVDFVLVLPTSENNVHDFSFWELLFNAIWVAINIDFVRFYLFFLFVSRFDTIIIMFLTKTILMTTAYYKRAQTKQFIDASQIMSIDDQFNLSKRSSSETLHHDSWGEMGIAEA